MGNGNKTEQNTVLPLHFSITTSVTSNSNNTYRMAFGDIYIDNPVYARADLNDDNDCSEELILRQKESVPEIIKYTRRRFALSIARKHITHELRVYPAYGEDTRPFLFVSDAKTHEILKAA